MSETTGTNAAASLARALGPPTLLTGTLYYFGWVRTRALAGYFGIDPAALNYSVADLVLRSVDSVLSILVVAAVSMLVMRAIFRVIVRQMAVKAGRKDLLVRLLMIGGWLGVAWSAWFLQVFSRFHRTNPVLVGLAVGVIGVSMLWAGQCLAETEEVEASGDLVGWSRLPAATTLPLTVLAAAAFFAIVFVQAATVGRNVAIDRAANLHNEPEVVLLSQDELNLTGYGDARVLHAHGAISDPWRFRYEGLRLYAEANGRWFLLPADWSANQTTYVVPISDRVRIDIDRD